MEEDEPANHANGRECIHNRKPRTFVFIRVDSWLRTPGTLTRMMFLHGVAEQAGRFQSPAVLENSFPDGQPEIGFDQRHIKLRQASPFPLRIIS
jgi:hypothetical protein